MLLLFFQKKKLKNGISNFVNKYFYHNFYLLEEFSVYKCVCIEVFFLGNFSKKILSDKISILYQ